jgi:hypothetical protein
MRAPTTNILRQHLGSGQIPIDSRVRRSDSDEWRALDGTAEFADLVHSSHRGQDPRSRFFAPESATPTPPEPVNLASRLEAKRLRTVGLRGLAEDLTAALENTMARPKLVVAGMVGVASGAVVAAAGSVLQFLPWPWSLEVAIATALVLLVMGSVANAFLTQLTYIELSRLRPPRWAEASPGLGRYSLRLVLALLATAGVAGAIIALLRWFPDQLTATNLVDPFKVIVDVAAPMIKVLAFLVELVLWPILVFTMLLGPVVVIEECSTVQAVLQWWRLVRRHLGRLFLYESLTFLAGIVTLVFAFPLGLAAVGRQWTGFATAGGFSFSIVAGLALAPLIAYLSVAHVFIYLKIRYEVDQRKQ